MNLGDPIEIIAVANGWMVKPADQRPDLPWPIDKFHVFQEMEGRNGLQEFIATHFLKSEPKAPVLCEYCGVRAEIGLYKGKPCCHNCITDPPRT